MSLHRIQSDIHAPKNKLNSFGKYNYRTAEGILAVLKAILGEGETVIVTDELREVAGQIFVQSTATITLADGASHSAVAFAMHPLEKKGMDASQVTGTASSYARKYALGGLLALDDGSVDPDATNKGEATKKPDPKPPATDESERDRLLAAINKQTDAITLRKLFDQPNFEAAIDELPLPMKNQLQTAFSNRMGELS